jgi:pimeloyl-ACP methyl ester carboxylesterase
MPVTDTGTLAVSGTRLFYEVRGEGPALLLVPGGNGDAGPYGWVADELARAYTVVAYDRRGFSRSPLDRPPDDDLRLALDVADAATLIDRFGGGRGYVFGSSSGAIVALELLARRPDRVRAVVAHEPPLLTVLPDAGTQLGFLDGVYDTYRQSNVDVAMRRFTDGVGLERPEVPEAMLPAPVTEMMARMRRNEEFFLEHELRQYTREIPDLAALQAAADRLVLAVGRDSRRHLPGRPAPVLAERLGLDVADFPGGHIGYVTHPAEFAARLREVLAGR